MLHGFKQRLSWFMVQVDVTVVMFGMSFIKASGAGTTTQRKTMEQHKEKQWN